MNFNSQFHPVLTLAWFSCSQKRQAPKLDSQIKLFPFFLHKVHDETKDPIFKFFYIFVQVIEIVLK
jgi:hypothetical protein